jgi:hypothetical protein
LLEVGLTSFLPRPSILIGFAFLIIVVHDILACFMVLS